MLKAVRKLLRAALDEMKNSLDGTNAAVLAQTDLILPYPLTRSHPALKPFAKYQCF